MNSLIVETCCIRFCLLLFIRSWFSNNRYLGPDIKYIFRFSSKFHIDRNYSSVPKYTRIRFSYVCVHLTIYQFSLIYCKIDYFSLFILLITSLETFVFRLNFLRKCMLRFLSFENYKNTRNHGKLTV